MPSDGSCRASSSNNNWDFWIFGFLGPETSLLLAFPTQRDRVSHWRHTQELDRKANKHLLQTALRGYCTIAIGSKLERWRPLPTAFWQMAPLRSAALQLHSGLKVILQLTFFRQLLICMTLAAWPFSGRQPQL